LGAKRVYLVLEGTAVNHLHAKLYPDINEERLISTGANRKTIGVYAGYINTSMGPKADEEELKAVQKEITS